MSAEILQAPAPAQILQFLLKNAHDFDFLQILCLILGKEFYQNENIWNDLLAWNAELQADNNNLPTCFSIFKEKLKNIYFEASKIENPTIPKYDFLIKIAKENGFNEATAMPEDGGAHKGRLRISAENFVYFAESNQFIYTPNNTFWSAAAVDSVVAKAKFGNKKIKASEIIKYERIATSIANDPILPAGLTRGYDVFFGELQKSEGAVFNIFKKPNFEIEGSDTCKYEKDAEPFILHCKGIFDKQGDAEQFLNYMAHRAQKPEEKPRFALIIAGGQGIGKDTAIEMCISAIGAWNVANIDPSALDSNFNEFMAACLVRINEAANLQEMNKWAFNERVKVLIAGSPDYTIINPKYATKYTCRLHCGVIITTNHLQSGIYIPQDDRRYDVIECVERSIFFESDAQKNEYFKALWHWYNNKGGAEKVAKYLLTKDLSGFSAANGQRKTEAHRTVAKTATVGDAWLADILETCNFCDFVPAAWVLNLATIAAIPDAAKKLPLAMQRLGYSLYLNQDGGDGRFQWRNKKTFFYKKSTAPAGDKAPVFDF